MRVSRRIAGAICILAFAGCSSQLVTPAASPKQLLADGSKELLSLRSVQLSGTFTVDQTSGSIRASILQNGDVSGLLTLGDEASNFVYAGGTTYFELFSAFGLFQFPISVSSLAISVKGTPWWEMPGSPAAAAVVRFLSFGGIKSMFLSGRSTLTLTTGTNLRGQAAYRISNSEGSVFVAMSQPHQVLEVTTSAHHVAGGLAEVDLVLDNINVPTTVARPTYALIPDLAHLPPYFYIDLVGFTNCGSSGCTLKAVVKADAGSGVANVTLSISDSAGGRLGDCKATTTLSDYKASETARCRVGGTTWTRWWDRGVGTSSIHGEVANPDYYGG